MPIHPDPDAFEQHRSAVRARLRTAGRSRPGPGSSSWTINREVFVVAGWGRAILLQLAHPLVAAGVDDHSGFRAGPLARLQRFRSTINAMRSLMFGEDDEAIEAAARINMIHDRVFGRLRVASGAFAVGTAYSAHAPQLLSWVHATLVDSVPRTFELLVGPLTPDARDRYCDEAAVIEPLLDLPRGLVPRSSMALDAYMREVVDSGEIVVTDTSRALARAVLYPPGWRLLWPLFRPVQLITIGLLPTAIREAYGFAWTPGDARALARWARGLRALRRVLPAAAREWPSARRRCPDGDLSTSPVQAAPGA